MQRDATEPFLTAFSLTHPIMQGPMGGVSGPNLVAAVANAGGLGTLPIWAAPLAKVLPLIQATQALTQHPFAVNVRADLNQHAHIDAALAAGITWFHLFWGDVAKVGHRVRDTGARLLVTVSNQATIDQALDAGAQCLIAQGVEAGGHVLSERPLAELLPLALARARSVPVLAAGGCSTASDVRHWLGAGAAGVVAGTRFAASTESEAHEGYKQALLDASVGATARSICFDDGWSNAPHRTLINDTVRQWQAAGQPKPGQRPGEGDQIMVTASGRHLLRYSVTPPAQGMSGSITSGAMYAGEGVVRIEQCLPAATIVNALAAGSR